MLPKLPNWVWLLLLGAVLILPRLGSYGLWDPAEIRHADVAREVAERGSWADVTVGGKYSPRPVLYVWMVAAGFKLGVNELAGRLPIALCGLLALLLAYHAGRRLVSDNAGLAAGFVLLTTPTFLFQSRQLTSDVVYYAALLAAIGGLAAFIWPADRRRSMLDLGIGAVGLVAGFLAKGLLLGAAFPLLVVATAVALGWRISDLEADQPRTVGGSLRECLPRLGGGVLVAAAVIYLLLQLLEGDKYMLFGGVYHKLAMPPTFDVAIRDLGFSFFPWVALAPLMLASFIAAQRGGETARGANGASTAAGEARERDAFLKLIVVIVAIVGYLIAVLWPAFFGKLRNPALPWLALGVGVWAYQAYTSGRTRPFWGLVAAVLLLVLHMDFYMRPNTFAFSHLLEHAKYPIDLKIKYEMRAMAILAAAACFLALGGPFGGIDSTLRNRRYRWRWVRALARAIDWIARQIDWLGDVFWLAGGRGNKHYWWAVAGLTLIFGGWCSHYLTPQLSLHMSNKALFQTYHRCKQPGEKLAQYQVTGRGASYYNEGQVDEIRHQGQLFKRLRAPDRVFVLVPANHLGAIDQAARKQRVPYYVLDDSSSHYLILSNKLSGSCAKDLNPLRELVVSQRPNPKKVVSAIFDNKVQLIGYDLDDVVTRGGKFTIKLYFKVLRRMPPGYKIFIHFDKPASRFHGDHTPLNGKYPTQYWLPGDYIIDPYEVDIPLLTTPSGVYHVYVGFWPGGGRSRLRVIKGPNDGANRVRLGTFRVR